MLRNQINNRKHATSTIGLGKKKIYYSSNHDAAGYWKMILQMPFSRPYRKPALDTRYTTCTDIHTPDRAPGTISKCNVGE